MNKVSMKAASLIGSEIIKLGNEINQKIKQGNSIYNLTIGDFNPTLFPIPDKLKDYIIEAYQNGETNYPEADGMANLKQAVIDFLRRNEGLEFSNEEVLIAGGGRPLIHGIYQAIVDPGDKVLYPVPSWNNNHYCYLADAQKIEIHTLADNGFMPTAAELAPYLSEVVMVALCSPLNPTGTTFKAAELKKICDLMVAENKLREGKKKPLYLLYDQIYWTLIADGFTHVNPISLCAEMKPYTLFVDGISKSLSATGVRVGWGMGPAEVINKMKGFIGHIGAWAPRAEQVATANFLNDVAAVNEFLTTLKLKINTRFDQLYSGFCALKADGLPVNMIKPEGAIYLSVQFKVIGMKRKDGTAIETTADITKFLLEEAELAIVPFTAFGCEQGTDWFRISIGTLPKEDISNLLEKLRSGLSAIK
ncbi:MAG: aminotransferase class I/II-fold pyridoxal phosphate-dependent enzyme [bacterium]|nr:aminotransferase class I/II-fold pyridoxal phosphate-dependent enzyme [bacterium]